MSKNHLQLLPFWIHPFPSSSINDPSAITILHLFSNIIKNVSFFKNVYFVILFAVVFFQTTLPLVSTPNSHLPFPLPFVSVIFHVFQSVNGRFHLLSAILFCFKRFIMLQAIKFGYGRFHLVMGDSIWIWAIPFCFGRFHFVLGDSMSRAWWERIYLCW